jgi:protein tyrosine phosphatase (PTP) superfamily phosphohydrolase (DUF442 family)
MGSPVLPLPIGALPMKCKSVSPRISVADAQPSRAAFATLAEEGYAAVVNLREEGEADERMSPAEEGEAVRACGMTYLHLPFSLGHPAAAIAAVDEFRRQMSAPPGRSSSIAAPGGARRRSARSISG